MRGKKARWRWEQRRRVMATRAQAQLPLLSDVGLMQEPGEGKVQRGSVEEESQPKSPRLGVRINRTLLLPVPLHKLLPLLYPSWC